MERIRGYLDIASALNLKFGSDESRYLDINFIKKLETVKSVNIFDYIKGKKIVFSFEYEDERYFFFYLSAPLPLKQMLNSLKRKKKDERIMCYITSKNNKIN